MAGKNPKKTEKGSDQARSGEALGWRERFNPEIAGSRWDLPSYKEMEDRKNKKQGTAVVSGMVQAA